MMLQRVSLEVHGYITIQFEPLAGTSIDKAAMEALILARKYLLPVELKFNGERLLMTPSASADEIVKLYHDSTAKRTMQTEEGAGRED